LCCESFLFNFIFIYDGYQRQCKRRLNLQSLETKSEISETLNYAYLDAIFLFGMQKITHTGVLRTHVFVANRKVLQQNKYVLITMKTEAMLLF
jgi:hypothetical protein